MVEGYNLRYKLTKSNHIEAIKYIRKRAMNKSRWRFLNLILGSILGFTFMATIISLVSFYEKNSYLDLTDLNIGLFSLLISLIFIFIISFSSTKLINSSFFREGSYYLDDYILTLTAEFINIKIRNNDYYYSLKGKLVVEENTSLIFIFFDGGVYIYIPQNVFSSDEAKKVFLDSVKIIN